MSLLGVYVVTVTFWPWDREDTTMHQCLIVDDLDPQKIATAIIEKCEEDSYTKSNIKDVSTPLQVQVWFNRGGGILADMDDDDLERAIEKAIRY